MRMRWVFGTALAVLTLCPPAWASYDLICEPSWRLSHPDRLESETTVMMAPGNDTVANMMLLRLQETGRPLTLHLREPEDDHDVYVVPTLDGPFYDWQSFLPRSADPKQDSAGDGAYRYLSNQRCANEQAAAAEYIAEVEKAGLPPGEEKALIISRKALSLFCSNPADTPRPQAPLSLGQSEKGGAFSAYLDAAWSFYDHEDQWALEQFTALGSQTTNPAVPWVGEASLYMQGRLGAMMARQSGTGKYGLLSYQAVDRHLASEARAAYHLYLERYPQGRYREAAGNAEDHLDWMTKDSAGFSAAFIQRWGPRFAAPAQGAPSYDDSRLIAYIDGPLAAYFNPDDLAQVKDPLLLAILDLRYMRASDDVTFCGTEISYTLTAQDLERQKPYFSAHPALYQMLRASHAYYIAKDPQAVLQVIPDDSAQPNQGAVPFTLRMLRGMALSALNDPLAMGYWQGLLKQVNQPSQAPLVELAIAIEAQMAIARGDAGAKQTFYGLFAPGGDLTSPEIRSRLLITLADAPLLRQQAQDPHASVLERQRALFALLYKELTWDGIENFSADVAMVPGYVQADRASALVSGPPALGLFTQPLENEDFTCPSPKDIAARLAANPKDAEAALCVADMVRLAYLDDFMLDYPPTPEVLGGGPSLHAGQPYNRMTTYRRIITDPQASTTARAYALYRAVKCYAPSGYNHCGGQDAPLEERRAWFVKLKGDYAKSRWAKELKYYW